MLHTSRVMLIFFALLAHAEPVKVALSLDDAPQHLVEVVATYPASEGGHDLVMANWTPGSYKIRDFARHVEGVQATADGADVSIAKVAKNRWRVEHPGPITVRYQVYAREMGVQTSFVDDQFASLNGAGLFLYEPGYDGPWELTIQAPEGWTQHSGLSAKDDTLHAANLDELIDSPVVLGEAVVTPFEVRGVPHELVSLGFSESFDADRAVGDLAALVEETAAFWGNLPYERYVFLALGTSGGGGLEHLDSTLMITGPDVMADDDAYERWLGLASHEFFHTWNIKRLRPAEYGPFDYEREVHSESLWVAEGLTSYYGDLLLHRSGLMSEDALLKGLSKPIGRLQKSPGREVRSLSDASFDAWIKHYQRDENTQNTSVSYYGKGAVVGFLIDAEIRQRTGGERSLDDAMRLAFERYSGERGFTPEEFVAVLSEVAGEDLTDFMTAAVKQPGELDYQPALERYGLRFKESEDDPQAWLGASVSGTSITRVVRGSPAWDAGLAVGDELIALDGRRIRDLDKSLGRAEAGAEVTVLMARRDRIEERVVVLGTAPEDLAIERVDKPNGKQKKALEAWLQTP